MAHARIDTHAVSLANLKEDIEEIKEGQKWSTRWAFTTLVAVCAWLGLQLWDRVQIHPVTQAMAAEAHHIAQPK